MDGIMKWLRSPAIDSITVKWWMALAFVAALLLCLIIILLVISKSRKRRRREKSNGYQVGGGHSENHSLTIEDCSSSVGCHAGNAEDARDSIDHPGVTGDRYRAVVDYSYAAGDLSGTDSFLNIAGAGGDGQDMPFLKVANFQGIGQRDEQQDAFGLSNLVGYREKGLLAVLCDGMGGMVQGREIAQTLVSDILSGFPYGDEKAVAEWSKQLELVSRNIHSHYQGSGGTTLVMAYLMGRELWCFSIGDSNIFLLRGNRLYEVNHKHEYINDLFVNVLDGRLSMEQALEDPQSGALSHFIGSREFGCDFTRRPIALEDGDTLLLCSDGISDTLNLQKIQNSMTFPPPKCCEELENGIETAAKANQDNYTGIVIRYNTNF